MDFKSGRYWDKGIQLVDGCTPSNKGKDFLEWLFLDNPERACVLVAEWWKEIKK